MCPSDHRPTDSHRAGPFPAAAAAHIAPRPSWAPQLAGALLPAQLPLSFFELTPSAVKILTKPSQPVFADVDALDAAAKCLPAGLFVLFHHQLGLVTDVQARLMGLHTLALAHLALPLSHVHQISGALRLKHQQELAAVEAKAAALEAAGTPRRVDVAEVWRPMQTFDMRQLIGQQLEERRQVRRWRERRNKTAASMLNQAPCSEPMLARTRLGVCCLGSFRPTLCALFCGQKASPRSACVCVSAPTPPLRARAPCLHAACRVTALTRPRAPPPSPPAFSLC